MKIRYIILPFVIFGILFSKNAVEIKVNQPGKLIIEVAIDTAWISHIDNQINCNPHLNNYIVPGLPMLPYWEEIFVGLPIDAKVDVFYGNEVRLGTYGPIISEAEKAKGETFQVPINQIFNGVFPDGQIKLLPIKEVNNLPSSKVQIYPFRLANDNLFIVKNLTVEISWDKGKISDITKPLSQIKSSKYFDHKELRKPQENIIPEYQFYQNIAKITVDSSAWYNITYSELLNFGLDISGIDVNSIRLWNKENEIDLLIESVDDIFNENDNIIFYGEKNQPPDWADYDNNFYTNDNIYWLTWGEGVGKRFSTIDSYPSLPPNQVIKNDNFIDIKKIERDDEYVRVNKNNQYIFQTWDVIDHFFMLPEIIVSGPFDFEFELDSPDLSSSDGFDLEVRVRGMTTLNHDLDILINNNLVNNSKWTERNNLHIEVNDIDCSILNDGVNTLSLNLSPNNPDAHDLVYLNWFELKYPRIFNTKNDYIKFSNEKDTNQTNEFEIAGYTDNDIYIFKNREQQLVNPQFENNLVKFQNNESNDSFYEVFTKDKLESVKNITVKQPISQLLQNISNEYVIIAPDSFFAILEPLSDYHNAQIVEIEDIYRQYSYGVLSPYAIKAFLEDIYFSNNEKLRYVLFTMTSDEINWWNGKFDHIPSIPAMLIYTYNMGVIVCDYWFGSYSEDFWIPELAIGRFPATTKAELQNMVDKTMFHHTRGIQNWDNNNLLIGGSDIGFKYQSESLVNNIKDSGAFVSRLYVAQTVTDTVFYGTADTLSGHFSNGISYINFFGHGGGRVWEDNGLLTFGNIGNLNNKSKYPFISSMSCHTGDFSYYRALSKQMVEYQNGGAFAWYSASGLGWNYNDYYLTIPMQELIFSDEDLTIGEIINLSKTKYYLAYSDIYPEIAGSQLYQYNLIGDPAIKLKKPINDDVFIAPLDPEPNEPIEIIPTITNADSLHYQIFHPDNYSLNKSTYLEGSSPFELAIPDTFQKGNYSINLSYKSGHELYNSSNSFTVSGSYINIMSTIPEIPTICDSIGVVTEVIDRNGISSVQLYVNNENWSEMYSIGENQYQSDRLIHPQPSGSTLNIYCIAIDAINDSTTSNVKSITINEIPEVSPVSGEFVIDDSINLIVNIESATETPVEVFADLFINRSSNWELIRKDTVNIVGENNHEAYFSGYYPVGINQYRVITNANLSCQTTNNVTNDTLDFELETTAFWVTPALGTTDDGTTHSPIIFEDIEIDIPSNIVNNSKIIELAKIPNINFTSQPDFEVLQIAQNYAGIEIKFDEETEYSINWILNDSISQYDKNLYQYFDEYGIWLPINFTIQNDSIAVIQAKGSSKFAFINSKDSEKPNLSATINNQEYLTDILISKNPNINVSIYDKNGVDFREQALEYSVNEQPIENFEYEISGGTNTLNLNFSPSLTALDSSISIISKDASGNQSDTFKIAFSVSEKIDVLDYGNFPNPFSDKTIFAYELTEEVDNLTFTIYSVEGRRIRKLNDDNLIAGPSMKLPGYHEIEWDGKNSDRNTVDNGNYFYQIRAKKNKKIVERTGKILKVK